MTPYELDRLVVKLEGEYSSFKKMVNFAMIGGKRVYQHMRVLTQEIKDNLEEMFNEGRVLAEKAVPANERYAASLKNLDVLLKRKIITEKEHLALATQAFKKLEAARTKEFRDTEKWVKATAKGQREVRREAEQAAKAYERFWSQAVKAQERAARALQREADKKARADAKAAAAAQRAHNQTIKNQQQVQQAAARAAANYQKWWTNAMNKQAAAAARAAAATARANAKAAAAAQRAHNQTIKNQQRMAAAAQRAAAAYQRWWTNALNKQAAAAARAAKQMQAYQIRVARTTQHSLNTVSRSARNLGIMWGMFVSTPIIGFLVKASSEFGKFENAMTSSLSIMGEVSSEMRASMEETAMAISERSTTTAVELAEAYFFLASAGFEAAEAQKALGIVERFSVAGRFDMASATRLLADAQTALGMRSNDLEENAKAMTRISDVLVKANTIANATAEQFARSLTTKSAKALQLVNKDVEEGVAVLAAYAAQGVKQELAGERLYIVLRDLERASNKNAEAWEYFGLKVYDARGQMLPLANILRQMEGRMGDMSHQQRAMTFSLLGFQDRSVAAIKGLIGMSDMIEWYEAQLRSAGGYTEIVASRQLASFIAQMKVAWNQLVNVGIEIGEMFVPALLWMKNVLLDGISWWRSLSHELKVVTVVMAIVAAAVGPALLVLSAVAAVLAVIAGAVAAIIAVGWPVALVFAGIALAVGEMLVVWGAWAAAIGAVVYWVIGPQGLKNIWTSTLQAVSKFVEGAVGFFANFRHNIAAIMKWLPGNWELVVVDMINLWAGLMKSMIHAGQVAFKTLVRLISAFSGWVFGVWQYTFTTEFVSAIAHGIVKAVKLFEHFQAQVWELIKAAFTGQSVDMSGFFSMMGKEFASGAQNSNFFDTAQQILNEGYQELTMPWEGFQSEVARSLGGDLNLAYGSSRSPGGYTQQAENAGRPFLRQMGLEDDDEGGWMDDPLEEMEKARKEAEKLEKEINSLTESLQFQADTLGLTQEEIKVYKLALLGASEAQVRAAWEASQAVKAYKEEEKAMKDLEKAAEDLKHPYEKFLDEHIKLEDYLRSGIITWDAYAFHVDKAYETMRRNLHMDTKSPTGGVEGFAADSLDAVLKRADEVTAKMDAEAERAHERAVGMGLPGFEDRRVPRDDGEPGGVTTFEELLRRIEENTRRDDPSRFPERHAVVRPANFEGAFA
jgi:TP901 family phage tail tape measure protein